MGREDLSTIKTLRQTHATQLKELESKTKDELDLFEGIRDYMKKRAEIEKEYADKLERLGKTLTVKRLRPANSLQRGASTLSLQEAVGGGAPDAAVNALVAGGSPTSSVQSEALTVGQVTYRGAAAKQAHTAFMTLLSETEKQSKYKSQIAERIVADVADVIKAFGRDKAIEDKKKLEFGTHYHENLSKAYQELADWSALYEKVQREAEQARQKYEDAIKPKKGALAALSNMMMGDNQERVERLRQKSKSTSRRLDEVRNEYLLAIDAANAIQSHYYAQGLPTLMRQLDGQFYPTLVTMLNAYGTMENDFAVSLRASTETWAAQADKVDRDRELGRFIADTRPLFDTPPALPFQRAGADDRTEIVLDEFTRILLASKLSKLLEKHADVEKELARRTKELAGLEQMVLVYSKTPEFGDAKNPHIEKMELEHLVELLTAETVRLAAVIKSLRDTGVTPAAAGSAGAGGVGGASGGGTGVGAGAGDAKPSENQVCAIYDYQANDPSELSFKAGDLIEVTYVDASGSDDGSNMWWEGTHVASGRTGNFAVTFTRGWQDILAAKGNRVTADARGKMPSASSLSKPAPGAGLGTVRCLYAYKASCDGELTFGVGDVITITSKNTGSDAWWEGHLSNGSSGQFPVNYVEPIDAPAAVPSVGIAAASSLVGSAGSRSSEHLVAAAPAEPVSDSGAAEASATGKTVEALYDYTAANDEELTFNAGDVITVTRDNVEEGWSEGRLASGQVGFFPLNYVH